MPLIEQIIELINDYENEFEESPTRIYIPRAQLNLLTLEFEDQMKGEVGTEGWQALGDPPHLFGMLVIIGGEEILVERSIEDLQ